MPQYEPRHILLVNVSMAEPIVQLSSLHKSYANLIAVDHLDLEIQPQSIFGFLGPNGAGKSTTLRMMLGLIRPNSGQIRIFNEDLKNHRVSILRRIGCIIEKPDFYLYLSALENIQLFARLSGIKMDHNSLTALFNRVGLAGREQDKVKTYSHGMKQRLGIAQALLHNPPLLILDEPTTGLDPQGIIDLRELILNLRDHYGKTIILSSHILSEIERIADDMVIIHKGKAIVQGKVSQLLSDQDLVINIECSNASQVALILSSRYPNPQIKIHSSEMIECRLSKADLPLLHRQLSDSPVQIYSIQYKKSLEDYFLQITKNES